MQQPILLHWGQALQSPAISLVSGWSRGGLFFHMAGERQSMDMTEAFLLALCSAGSSTDRDVSSTNATQRCAAHRASKGEDHSQAKDTEDQASPPKDRLVNDDVGPREQESEAGSDAGYAWESDDDVGSDAGYARESDDDDDGCSHFAEDGDHTDEEAHSGDIHVRLNTAGGELVGTATVDSDATIGQLVARLDKSSEWSACYKHFVVATTSFELDDYYMRFTQTKVVKESIERDAQRGRILHAHVVASAA